MSDIAKLIEAVEAGELGWNRLATLAEEVMPPKEAALAATAYNGSLDAAKVLHEELLPGWFPGMSQNIHSGYWFAWVQTRQDKHFSATEADPARAWLLAILRAVEANG